ncbi:hypothetical protein EXD82_02735 [Peptacetobacter hominis]|uniref:Uncharacterized protein n=1 Tax=Peptacetobacter hominis TaxID=2743610 RepID=A0A544QX77_9FIRM|nr:hypothetical protein [Peptacetobacter hominis]TQQ85327.1 hypothetical protein EXD82_02735 [Peptacetobacter hominis]
MQLNNYLEYLEKTVMSYSDKVKNFLVKEMMKQGIATKGSNLSGQLCIEGMEAIDISEKTTSERLNICINQSKRAGYLLEKWEFVKDYKYSVIFTCDKFLKVLEKVEKIKPLGDLYENDYLETSFVEPVAYEMDDYYFLKFNLAYSAIHPLTQEEFLIKYPFLVVFHKKHKLVEFRFDVLKKVFLSESKGQNIYATLISEALCYLESNFDCYLKPLDLDFMISVCKNDENVKLIAQYMKLPSGGNAQLEVGNNQEYILPFIGELRALLNDYQEDLKEVPEFRDAMEQFLFEMEEMSDYPWIELLWENEIKTRSNHIKLVSNYMNESYYLIQYYYSNVLTGMERMNDVIEYIVNHRNCNTEQIE